MNHLCVERAGRRESDHQSLGGGFGRIGLFKLDVIFVNVVVFKQVNPDFGWRRHIRDERALGAQVVHHVHHEEEVKRIVIAPAFLQQSADVVVNLYF